MGARENKCRISRNFTCVLAILVKFDSHFLRIARGILKASILINYATWIL